MAGEVHVNAQRAVLGSLLIDPEATAGLIFAGVREDDFTGDLRSVFRAARELFFSGTRLDAVILADRLGDGYAPLLAELMRETPTAANVREYLSITRREAQLARVRQIAAELAFEANDLERSRELTARAALALDDDGGEDDAVTMAEMVSAFFDRHSSQEARRFLPWGYELLDRHLYTEEGDLVILGGYPSAGKSLMSIQVALRLARAGYRVGYFSLETEPRTKIADRVMCHAARVPLPKIKANDFNDADIAALTAAGEELRRLPVEFFPAGGYSLADIQARTLAKRYQVILIDYLQLIQAPGSDLREQVTAVSKGLHTLAQRHGVCVIALSQLSRPGKEEGGKARRPTMYSLRESGQLEQDADAVLLLYNETPEDRNGPRRLQIAKNKEGSIDSCLLEFDGAMQTLSDPKADWRSFRGKKRSRIKPEPQGLEQVTLRELADDEGGDLPF